MLTRPALPGYKDDRTRLELLRAQLELERSSFDSHWRDLADSILPRRARFTITDTNRGERKNQKIINSTATQAARTLRAGMMSGITSPARPWFRLTTPDPELAEFGPVKDWLHDVATRMSTVFLRSNLYQSLPITYGDIGVFGTHAMMMEEDFKSVIHTTPFPIGEYCLFTDDKGRVAGFQRKFLMTVRQVVMKFGKLSSTGHVEKDNLSERVRSLWQNNQTETAIEVCHVVEPNPYHDESRLESGYKKFRSVYYETGSLSASGNYISDLETCCLSDKGYDFFPILAPRWEVAAGDVYATSCPGMDALGDIRAMQTMEKRLAQGVEKMVFPPMVADPSLRSQPLSILPGKVTYSADAAKGGFRPAHEVDPRVDKLEVAISRHELRIERAFYSDLFLMLARSDRRQITAREIDERHEEKLLALGPVLEQINQDLADPLIDNTFMIMSRQGLIPEAPRELQGVNLRVEYISMMAQAQKLIGAAGMERFATVANNIGAANPAALDKVDFDQFIDEYSNITGIPPRIVRTDEQVAAIRQARSEQQAAQEKTAQLAELAKAGKTASEIDTTSKNGLTDLMEMSAGGLNS